MTENSTCRILTVRQPWAWAIIHGGKNVENRVRNIAGEYRGPVLIHVAKKYAAGWTSPVLAGVMNRHDGVYAEPQPWRDHSGMIIGVVDLVDSHPVDACIEQQHDGDWLVCSEWAERAGHHLVLANPRGLDDPFPYTGMLGLGRTDFRVVGDWLAYQTNACTCGGADQFGDPVHEPECGLAPMGRLVAIS
ncbi:hypothetical protein [Microbacterium maritypicum]